ncbi:MAG: N-acetylmuramoyl-L-alanine amidase [Bacillota bacterium]
MICLVVALTNTSQPVRAGPSDSLLYIGSTGPAVLELQGLLKVWGYDPGPADGIFGPATRGAVLAFQKAAGIAVDGIVGPITWQHLRQTPSRGSRKPLSGITVAIDPGHGGVDPGAYGVCGTREADLTLAVCLELQKLLVSGGARVVMTRTGDYEPRGKWGNLDTLEARVQTAEEAGAQVMISVHHNVYLQDPTVSGAIGFYKPGDSQSKSLALCLVDGLEQYASMNNLGIEPGYFYVIRHTTMPSVLMEIGFLSNGNDEKRLNDSGFRYNVALGLYRGVLNYFGKKP